MTTPQLLLAWLATFGADNVWRVGPQEPIWAPRLLYIMPWAILAAVMWQMTATRRLSLAYAAIIAFATYGMLGAFFEPRGGLGLYSAGVGAIQVCALSAAILLFIQAPDRYRNGVAGGLMATHAATVLEFGMSRSAQMAPAIGQSRLAAIYGEWSDVGMAAACVILMAVGMLWGAAKER